MSRLQSLKASTSLSDLASLLNTKPAALSFILFKQSDSVKYKTFNIPKRNGGVRVINAPINHLKRLQEKLSILLQDCVDEINVLRGYTDRAAHGFTRERSIITNAAQHRHRRYIFNVDLKDFFPSINFGRVRGFFLSDKSFALHERVATVIAQIACRENELPQGSPCSPVISNLIGHILDMHLVGLAAKVGCSYSRYADDLTFSTNKKTFPAEIARSVAANVWLPGTGLEEIVMHSGFQLNMAKTTMQYKTSRQEVTGLVVNAKVNVPREYRHVVRAMVFKLLKTGSFEIFASNTDASGKVVLSKQAGTLNQLHGMLGFVDGIDLYNKGKVKSCCTAQDTTKELMYRRFLLYKDFYTAERPVIVAEGKTDNAYLTQALLSLASEFPELAEIGKDGKKGLKIRVYKVRKRGSARIVGLKDGGSGSLTNFIKTYRLETAKFEAPGQKKPVIILYDNDSGAKAIRGQIRAAGVTVTGAEPFVHVTQNLYAVPTPLIKGKSESAIEDFFSAELKATKVGGKTFNPSDDCDTEKQYGKHIFAQRVVKVRVGSIDFGGFRPLLTNLVKAIKTHEAKVAGL